MDREIELQRKLEALIVERTRLWDALAWIEMSDPEIVAAAEEKFRIDIRRRRFADITSGDQK
jgi:hypothetical protein